VAVHQVKTTVNGAQHAQSQAVDLEQAKCVQIILVPLNHGSVRHGCVFNGHHPVECLAGDHKSTDVL
jgi:hypothetical protein